MARGRAARFGSRVSFALVLILSAVIVFAIRPDWNPFPMWWANFQTGLKENRPIADPPTTWIQRTGDPADLAGVITDGDPYARSAFGSAVIVTTRGHVEARGLGDGRQLWIIESPWARPAGDVVVVGRPDTNKGFLVYGPYSATPLWSDDAATAVWAYSDKIIDLTCKDDVQCVVRGRDHDGRHLWSVTVPGGKPRPTGPNPTSAGLRPVSDWFNDARTGAPGPAPGVLGVTTGGKTHLIDLVGGVNLRDVPPADKDTRMVVAASRVIYAQAEPVDDTCRYRVWVVDADSGAEVWRDEGLNLNTANRPGCEQRRDPQGGHVLLSGTGGDNRPELNTLAYAANRTVWVGALGQKVLDTDGDLAVVLNTDQNAVDLVDLAAGNEVVATVKVRNAPDVAITPSFVLLHDHEHVTVLSRAGGVLRSLTTEAKIIGYGYTGLVLAQGRVIGYVDIPVPADDTVVEPPDAGPPATVGQPTSTPGGGK
ncbi:hypothetical protein GCM10009682_18620 [Luedemannella flava]|uniref:PQQ-binding-like beta-propeller repeat protein n=1 Tax=Luedemannella flava TaxID=349316 RepID=A0ABP4Y309_9ACTN